MDREGFILEEKEKKKTRMMKKTIRK